MRFARIAFISAADATAGVPDLVLGLLFIAAFVKTPASDARGR